jgi:hypothetical protein
MMDHKHSHLERGGMGDFLQALIHSTSKIPLERNYKVLYPGDMECSLVIP